MSDHYTPPHIIKPQVNISRSTALRMWLVVLCVFPAVIQSAVGDSGVSLRVAFAAVFSAVLAEWLMTRKQYGFRKITNGSAAASGLILALMLPNYIHPVYAVLGAAFAMIVVKYSFGGLGSNWLNPALAGWLFIRLSWPGAFEAPAPSASPELSLGYLPQTGSAAAQSVSAFLNRYVFSFLGAELPSGYVDLFSSQSPGIIADRAVLALVLATLTVSAFMISRLRLSVLYLAVFCLLVRIFGDIGAEGVLFNGDVFLALFSGGTLPAAFFLIAEPSGGAKSLSGGAVVAVIAAFFSLVFRYFGGEPYGCFYAVALAGALTPLLYRAEHLLLYAQRGIASTRDNASKGGGSSRGGGK